MNINKLIHKNKQLTNSVNNSERLNIDKRKSRILINIILYNISGKVMIFIRS